MGCTGRYSEAWMAAAFGCIASLIARTDNGVGNARAALSDSQVDFVALGIQANKGMVLYNLTDGSSGPVTAVTQNTLTATLTGGTDNLWDNGDSYRITVLDAQEIAMLNNALDIAAADIHAALAASGACDCTLASWATTFLAKINVIESWAFYRCPCAQPNISDDVRQNYLEWATSQIELLRTGKLDVCSGATGSEFPSFDWAAQGITEFSQAQIIWDDIQSS